MISCLLQIPHSFRNIRRDTQPVCIDQPPQIVCLPVIPVNLVQILARPNVILRRTPTVKVAFCQIKEPIFAALIAGKSQQLNRFRVVLCHPFSKEVSLAQHIVAGDVARGKLLFVAFDGIGLILRRSDSLEVAASHITPCPRLAALSRLFKPIQGILFTPCLLQILRIDGLMKRMTVFCTDLPEILRLLRLGKDDIFVPLGIITVQIVGRKIDAAPQSLPE